MTNMTRAKWKVCLCGSVLWILSPFIIVGWGAAVFWEIMTDWIADEFRWAKYVDDYEAKGKATITTSECGKTNG
jgi:hypothetical protein